MYAYSYILNHTLTKQGIIFLNLKCDISICTNECYWLIVSIQNMLYNSLTEISTLEIWFIYWDLILNHLEIQSFVVCAGRQCSGCVVWGLHSLGPHRSHSDWTVRLRSGPHYDNSPNSALLPKSRINACFKGLTWPPIQTCMGLTGLPWYGVIIPCRGWQGCRSLGELSVSV